MGGRLARYVALWTVLPPLFASSSSATSAALQLLIVIDLHRCEKAWCALLQSLQIKILYFMQTSLKPMRSSCGHVAQRLLSASRRSWLSCFM